MTVWSLPGDEFCTGCTAWWYRWHISAKFHPWVSIYFNYLAGARCNIHLTGFDNTRWCLMWSDGQQKKKNTTTLLLMEYNYYLLLNYVATVYLRLFLGYYFHNRYIYIYLHMAIYGYCQITISHWTCGSISLDIID